MCHKKSTGSHPQNREKQASCSAHLSRSPPLATAVAPTLLPYLYCRTRPHRLPPSHLLLNHPYCRTRPHRLPPSPLLLITRTVAPAHTDSHPLPSPPTFTPCTHLLGRCRQVGSQPSPRQSSRHTCSKGWRRAWHRSQPPVARPLPRYSCTVTFCTQVHFGAVCVLPFDMWYHK